jgi:hypothetical protein
MRPVFVWFDTWSPGEYVRDSTWLFAWLEVFSPDRTYDLIGTIFVLSLRLLGLLFRQYPMQRLAQELRPGRQSRWEPALSAGG